MNRKRVAGIAASLCLCSALLAPPAPATAPDELLERCSRIEAKLPKLLELADQPGLSMAIANKKGVVWSTGLGERSAGSGRAVDSSTVFEAASLSKPVFAYAVLRLVDEGLLELDTPLVEYGSLADVAHDPQHLKLTARMILSHTPGLPNWRPGGGPLEFLSPPGERWRYSGEGFVLLQRVVEELTGDTIEGIAKLFVFEPLGMTSTSYVWNDAFGSNLAKPHDAEGKPYEKAPNREGNAAYSLLTTAPDYARFLSAMLRGEGLKPKTHEAIFVPQTEVSPGVSWGLGWGLEEHEDGHSFWHWGHNDGFRAYTVAYPARDLAVVYFANSDNGMRLLRDLIELATADDDHPAIRHLDYDSIGDPTEPEDDGD